MTSYFIYHDSCKNGSIVHMCDATDLESGDR